MKSRKPIVADSVFPSAMLASVPDNCLITDNSPAVVPGIIPDPVTMPISGSKCIRKQLANNSTGIPSSAKRIAGNKRKSANKASDDKPGRKSGNRKAVNPDSVSSVSVPVNPDPSLSADSVPKKRGRPKGSKDITKRKTKLDNTQSVVPLDDRLRMMKFDRILLSLGKVSDRDNLDIITDRINTYLSLCEQHQIMPTVSGFALSLGIDRRTLWDWIDGTRGTIKNPQVVDTLKSVYSVINTQYEQLLTEGKMIPVSAFFLMQNNHGYKQQTDYVISPNNNPLPTLSDITSRAGLLEE